MRPGGDEPTIRQRLSFAIVAFGKVSYSEHDVSSWYVIVCGVYLWRAICFRRANACHLMFDPNNNVATPTPLRAQLNADIALFRDLNPSNYNSSNGNALCGFEDQTSRRASIPVCPHIDEAVLIGAELKHDNVQFKVRLCVFMNVAVRSSLILYRI
jgi:hypothetical protein